MSTMKKSKKADSSASKTKSARNATAARKDVKPAARSKTPGAAGSTGKAAGSKKTAARPKLATAPKSSSPKSSSPKSAAPKSAAAKSTAARSAAARSAAAKSTAAKSAPKPASAPRGAAAKPTGAKTVANSSARPSAAASKAARTPVGKTAAKSAAKAAPRTAAKVTAKASAKRTSSIAAEAPVTTKPELKPAVAHSPASPPKAPAIKTPAGAKEKALQDTKVVKGEKGIQGAGAPEPGGAPASAPAAGASSSKPAPSAPQSPSRTMGESTHVAHNQNKNIPSHPSKPAVRATSPHKPATHRPAGVKLGFKPQEFIVYPAHGVGQITAIEVQEVAGFQLELFVISFIKDKMILKVPTPKVSSVGMRKLADTQIIGKALDTLTGRARIKRTMWSRRAQEYEAKINSGDLIAIAEVVRDLYRSDAQPEQSYSERQLYEAAVDRMSRELAVVNRLSDPEALKLIETQLQKGPRRGAKSDVEAETEVDGDIEEAA